MTGFAFIIFFFVIKGTVLGVPVSGVLRPHPPLSMPLRLRNKRIMRIMLPIECVATNRLSHADELNNKAQAAYFYRIRLGSETILAESKHS